MTMAEQVVENLLAHQIPQEKIQIMQQHPLYPQMLQLCKMMTRNKGIIETLNNAPLKTLQDLQVIAVCHKMREPLIIIDNAIQANLKAQQWAMDAQQWARGLKNLRQSMESRYKQMRALRLSIETEDSKV